MQFSWRGIELLNLKSAFLNLKSPEAGILHFFCRLRAGEVKSGTKSELEDKSVVYVELLPAEGKAVGLSRYFRIENSYQLN